MNHWRKQNQDDDSIPPGTGIIAWTVTMAIVIVILLIANSCARAHEAARPELNGWFMQLKSDKGLCCDGDEALHLRDVEWETQDKKDSHFRVKVPTDAAAYERARHGESVDTVWVDVPDDAVIDEPNKAGSALVWPVYNESIIWIRCFMPGAET